MKSIEEIREIARRIFELTPPELAALNDLIDSEGGPPLAGVREPRRPDPEDDEGQAIAEDYWETAE